MQEWEITAALADLPLGGLRFFETTGSTNEDALEWAASGARDLSLVVADEQTAGRGRAGRKWHTPRGAALALSLILRPTAIERTLSFANQLTGEPIALESRMTELSGGQTRALLIADATIICNTPIVLLDEVENAGIHRTRAVQLLRQYHKIFIFVTHDPRIAAYAVEAENFESIHNHSAYARISRGF